MLQVMPCRSPQRDPGARVSTPCDLNNCTPILAFNLPLFKTSRLDGRGVRLPLGPPGLEKSFSSLVGVIFRNAGIRAIAHSARKEVFGGVFSTEDTTLLAFFSSRADIRSSRSLILFRIFVFSSTSSCLQKENNPCGVQFKHDLSHIIGSCTHIYGVRWILPHTSLFENVTHTSHNEDTHNILLPPRIPRLSRCCVHVREFRVRDNTL